MIDNVTYKKLGEVADTFRGLTYSKGDEVPFSSKGVLRSNNIDLATHALNFEEIKYLREDFKIPEDRKLKKNSIFICMSNGSMQHLGKVAFVDEKYDYAFGGFMGLIVPHTTINPKYVYYCLTAPQFLNQILKNGRGANINNLTFSAIEDYTIPVPSLEDQQRIVRELDAIHAILAAKNTQLRELDNLAQAVFYDMFGDPITNEKGWDVKKIGDVCKLKAGKGIKAAELQEFSPNLYPCYGGNGIRGYIDRYSHEEDCPIIGRQGALCGNVNYAVAPFYATEHAVVAQPMIQMNNLWLYYQLKNMNLERLAHGMAQPGLSVQDITPLEFPLPPLDLQQAFASKITAIEQQKTLIRASIAETETLLAARMQHYFD